MFGLVITVVIALGFALFATQNTSLVDISFGSYILPNVPLYLVMLLPLILGLLASLVIHTAKDLSQSLTINEQKEEIEKLKEENTRLTQQLHKSELENTKMKAEKGEFDEDSIQQ